MKTNHTPGPWYDNETEYQGLVISEVTGKTIAVTYDKRDAKPIAALPDLLEACEMVAEFIEDSNDYADLGDCIFKSQEIILNAIKKATE